MTNTEIKQKIDENNKQIEYLMTPNIFTLNNAVSELLQENEELRSHCNHEYENGFCKYCYRSED